MNINHDVCPTWPAPKGVMALSTTRLRGHSFGKYSGLNLGQHVGDDPNLVDCNRTTLTQSRELPNPPIWLNQTHSIDVQILTSEHSRVLEGDASFTESVDVVCCVMTADCLPVLFCNKDGTQVAAAHAGWRGLVDGILENTVANFSNPENVMAWLAPAIGAHCFEVGADVRDAFIAKDPNAELAFLPYGEQKWLADLYLLARQRLNAIGITQIYGGEYCTYSDPDRFYSYRRDGVTGRQASLIWISSAAE